MDGNPLNEQHLTQINDGLRQADEAMRQIELAKRAGLDVSLQEQQVQATKARLLQIKQVYFPGR